MEGFVDIFYQSIFIAQNIHILNILELKGFLYSE